MGSSRGNGSRFLLRAAAAFTFILYSPATLSSVWTEQILTLCVLLFADFCILWLTPPQARRLLGDDDHGDDNDAAAAAADSDDLGDD